MIKPPTSEEIFYDYGIEDVYNEVVGTWRWGNDNRTVWYRKDDDTYWETYYRTSTCGETNDLRDGLSEIVQVFKTTETLTITSYVEKLP